MSRTRKPTKSTDHETFREALEGLGLSQASFARLLHHLAGQAVAVITINRWATGRQPVPATTTALLKVLAMLPEAKLRRLIKDADAAGQD